MNTHGVRSTKEEMQAKLEDRRRKIEGLPPILSSEDDQAQTICQHARLVKQQEARAMPPVAGAGA